RVVGPLAGRAEAGAGLIEAAAAGERHRLAFIQRVSLRRALGLWNVESTCMICFSSINSWV
ncbi:hypothetical protein K0U00_20000, partial [Paenibacillus sepulcri]|nr:hypothetical protein [Paenibacillus sepulcri]